MRGKTVVKVGLAAVAGGSAAVGCWWLGPEVGVPVVLGAAVAGGLLGFERLRVTILQQGSRLQRSADRIVEDGARRTDLTGLEWRLKDAREREFSQVEALLNLHRLVPVQSGMPPARGWAVRPDLLLLLVSLVQQHRPTTVVDLGSGCTTLWMATAMRAYGIEGQVIALDHDENYAQLTRDALVAHGLEKFAVVRHAPLTTLELGGEEWPWYDLDALADLTRCDLLVVDGPPGGLRAHSRYPAVPMLADRLAPQAVVVVDDYARLDENAMVTRWRDEYPGWSLRELAHEKGTAVLSRTSGRA